MFKVEFFVDDKRLGQALLALVGIANSQPSVVPVVNVAKKANGTLAPKVSGGSMERFVAVLKKHKGKSLKAAEFKAMMKPMGLSASSANYMTGRAVEAGLLKKTGKSNQTAYLVL